MYETVMFHKTVSIKEIKNKLIDCVITSVSQNLSQIQLNLKFVSSIDP